MRNLGIGVRLGIGFGVVLLLSTLMMGLGIHRLQGVAERTRDMMQQPLAKERMVSDWYRLMYASVRRTTAVAKSSDPSLGAFFAAETKASAAAIAVLRDKVQPMLATDAEKAAFEKILKVRDPYNASRDKITKLKEAGDTEGASVALEKEFVPAGEAYLGEIQKLLDIQRSTIDDTAKEIDSIYVTARNGLIGLGVVVLGIGVAFAFWLSIGITRPLHRAVAIARTVASGDLSSHIVVDSKDETGQLLDALSDMNSNILRIVTQVRTGTDSIATGTSQIAAGNADLSQRTEEQAASLEETAASMEAADQHRAPERRQRAAGQPAGRQRPSEIAVRGGEVVGQVVDTMDEINDRSRQGGRHHRRDRGHRLPDQYPGAERRGRSGARGRPGPRLCRGGGRGAQPRAAQRDRRQGNQGADRRLGPARGERRHAGGEGRPAPWARSSRRSSA